MYFTYFTNWIIISHIAIVTRCLVCVLQNCEKRRTVRRTRTALNNVISETSLPVTQFDTSFETLINTRQHTIQDIVRDALQQHGYWHVCSSFIVCFSIAVNRCKFHFISSFHLYHSVYFFLQIRSHSTERWCRTGTRTTWRTTITRHCIPSYSIHPC